MTLGGRNLVMLGLASIAVALTTTSVSLVWYHNSGDIYLDRSRPGYLPDEEEIEESDPESDFNFSKTGELDTEVLDEYIDALNTEIKAIEIYDKPFNAAAISDEVLGIPEE